MRRVTIRNDTVLSRRRQPAANCRAGRTDGVSSFLQMLSEHLPYNPLTVQLSDELSHQPVSEKANRTVRPTTLGVEWVLELVGRCARGSRPQSATNRCEPVLVWCGSVMYAHLVVLTRTPGGAGADSRAKSGARSEALASVGHCELRGLQGG